MVWSQRSAIAMADYTNISVGKRYDVEIGGVIPSCPYQ